MVETDDRDPLETQELRRLIAPVTGDDLTALVDQNGRIETECVDASRDRPHLDPAMLARIARISAQGSQDCVHHQDYQLNQYSSRQLSALYSRRTK
jgi:hypothetical protein